LAVAADGATRVLFDAEESELFALAADGDGLLVGSSPAGKVYRVRRDGSSEVLFDPEETYVWSVARAADGALWVATGDPGRLYRVRPGAPPEKVWDGGAGHVRSLLLLANGDVLFGTAGDGRLLRWRAGVVRTLHDSALTEVVALAPAEAGAIWMAVLSSEASFVDLAPRSPAGADEAAGAVVIVEEGGAVGSRPAGARGPRSELWRLSPAGLFERVWSSAEETVFSLLADGGRLWVGTGLTGRLYRFEADQPRVEREFDAKQVVALAAGRDGPVALTTNAAELWRFTSRREAKGTYTSPALDALQVARFGVFRWSGDLPEGSAVRASFRSGFASEPDATWSDWSAPRAGRELSLADLDAGRFVQYRLELEAAGGRSPRLVSAELTYRQENARPVVGAVTALDPGQILVPAGFNPAEQLYEPTSPNREGIFDTLKPAAPRDERLKGVWRVGWQTVRWEAQDPNGDELRYRLEVRPEGSPDAWLEIVDEHDAAFFAFDAATLPDGLYRFRVTASDARGNPAAGEALAAAAESEVVTIDRTPPELAEVKRAGRVLNIAVYDAANPLREADLSVDGAPWKPLRAADGLLDGRREELVSDEIPAEARLVLLRVADAAFNVKTFDLTAHLDARSKR
ncbi:MAG: hypothetical protein NDJ75_11765, partial [Thermoanaerobaculia bacterium]|nr:hypothetical protein [Thermoanaerobaculia bacterium]